MENQNRGGIQTKGPADISRVFQSTGFKEWVEQTSLFASISRWAGTGMIIEGIPDGLRLQLNGISKVEKAEDLPMELLAEFYRNSPWNQYNVTVAKIHKLIENEKQDDQDYNTTTDINR